VKVRVLDRIRLGQGEDGSGIMREMCEKLEERRLLSASVSLAKGWLTVHGTDGDDAIRVTHLGQTLAVSVGENVFRFALKKVQLVVIYGGQGNDTINCRLSPVLCFVRGEGGNDTVLGSNFDDTLIGGSGDDSIKGGPGNDLLVGQRGDDALRGGPGRDTLFGIQGSDSLFGDEGNDFLSGSGNDFLAGGDGDDTLSENQDAWWVGLASTTVYVGQVITISLFRAQDQDGYRLPIANRHDTLSGGNGRDIAVFSHRSEALTLSLDDEPNDGAPGENDNILTDVEDIIGGMGSDLITGDDQSNYLDGGVPEPGNYGNPPAFPDDPLADQGDDTIYGMGGNDVLYGRAGFNMLFGGDGDDVLITNGNMAADSLDGGDGDDSAQVDVPGPGGSIVDTYSHIEHVQEFPIEPVGQPI
jgi:Ca2+-binding RTX toxin-like protein